MPTKINNKQLKEMMIGDRKFLEEEFTYKGYKYYVTQYTTIGWQLFCNDKDKYISIMFDSKKDCLLYLDMEE
jgi:hypothetical protein